MWKKEAIVYNVQNSRFSTSHICFTITIGNNVIVYFHSSLACLCIRCQCGSCLIKTKLNNLYWWQNKWRVVGVWWWGKQWILWNRLKWRVARTEGCLQLNDMMCVLWCDEKYIYILKGFIISFDKYTLHFTYARKHGSWLYSGRWNEKFTPNISPKNYWYCPGNILEKRIWLINFLLEFYFIRNVGSRAAVLNLALRFDHNTWKMLVLLLNKKKIIKFVKFHRTNILRCIINLLHDKAMPIFHQFFINFSSS